MPIETTSVEYETMVVGAAYLVKQLLSRLGVVPAIDQALTYQPEIEATYGQLSQVIITNRLSFQPVPIYEMAAWAQKHGMDQVFALQAAWLDDDRLGALLEGVADHSATIWTTIIQNAVQRFQVDLDWLHADTSTIYFEGVYEDEPGQPKGGEQDIPLLVEGYNKDGQRNKVQLVLSLITSGRMPLWHHPWAGNQTDEGVYVADMNALRQALFAAGNAVLIGDRKLGTTANQLALCRQGQQFITAHPWTDTAKAVWLATYQQLQAGQLSWTPVDYASRNKARQPLEKRPRYQVCEIQQALADPETHQVYPLRWVFIHCSDKAEQDARQRDKALQAGEQALRRIAGLLGKYDYKDRPTIETRLTEALRKAKAQRYFSYTLQGTAEGQDWVLRWQRQEAVINNEQCFDGIALLSSNVLVSRLSAGAVMVKYKEQVYVEQTIDFIKSPVQIRPMWLHKPKRLVGLTLLIMIAVLVAALLEHQIRRWIAKTGQKLKGLMPEGRDNPYPTAKALLRAFGDYALVVRNDEHGSEVHPAKLRSIQQQIWDALDLPP